MNIFRGDIFYIQQAEYNAPTEPELRPGRPAVIVSNNGANASAQHVTVVYLTAQEKPPLPTHARVYCKQPSTALCEQIYTVMKNRIGTYVRTCSAEEMQGIDAALLAQFSLNSPDSRSRELTERTAKLEAERALMESEASKAAETNAALNAENVRLRAELVAYRHMYEQLLDRLLEGPKQ